jgi:hypothetical protein
MQLLDLSTDMLRTSTMTAHASVAAAMTAHRPTLADTWQHHHLLAEAKVLDHTVTHPNLLVLQALAAAAVCAQASSPENLG